MSLDRPNPFVQSRCPNCDTLYHIDEETLAEAEGQARCFRCGTIFYALAQQAEEQTTPGDEEAEIGTELELTRLVESLEQKEPEPKRESVPIMLAAAEMRSAQRAEKKTFEPVAEPGTPPAPSAADSMTATVAEAEEAPKLEPWPTTPPPFEIPDDLPELEPTEEPAAAAIEQRHGAGRLFSGLLKLLLVLVLVLAGLTQWLWFQPQLLHPIRPYYAQLQDWCRQLDCPVRLPPLPVQQSLESFAVLQREIGPAPEQSNALRVSLAFVNGADFPQPYPDVLLTLSDISGATVAERRLTPDEYLGPDDDPGGLMDPQEVISFDLLTEDPGESATGFKLKFL